MNTGRKEGTDRHGKTIKVPKKSRFRISSPTLLIATGCVLLILLAGLFLQGRSGEKDNKAMFEYARQTFGHVSDTLQYFHRVLDDPQIQGLAVAVKSDPEKLTDLHQHIQVRIPELIEVSLFEPELGGLRGKEMGPFGYAILDMLLVAEQNGRATVQLHGNGSDAYLAVVTRLGSVEIPLGFLLIKIDPIVIKNVFNASLQSPGMLLLDQRNGRFVPTRIVGLGKPLAPTEHIAYLRIPDSLLRIGIVQSYYVSDDQPLVRPLLFAIGMLMLALGLLMKFRPGRPMATSPEAEETVILEEDRLQMELREQEGVSSAMIQDFSGQQDDQQQGGEGHDDGLGEISLPDLGFNLEHPSMQIKKTMAPVELVESIFRAYDIRGIVGKTLDADVARQVGQVVGSLAMEANAGPVIVARDGRESGPMLVEGMIKGISSTGCDVVDVGAVPTGVLYFAAYEYSNGTGVMITGSHNPPDYNGFKILVGGVTQAGEKITNMYERILSGNLRVGKGDVSTKDIITQYREKISGDIQLQRPLKVVADCGNGIGGVCAADVLRDIGAEVIPLFDEVDGTFPNHHPDPSEPENLQYLIDSVDLMKADIGVAFDGDADRLGVVTRDGKIIYADRLMMLFVKDVLAREPGATIIYDVKCTGHLHHVIEEAGGRGMMYKTGHSLIKNKMKEVNAPFAGEMSGHFFFKERWYGFDCGIYSAARLLEILAKDSREPHEVLNSLPDSVSTPELKVQMEEGENHAFVAEMKAMARFANAKMTTIDGVRADYPDGWGLVRASNTTPILVLRFDADNKEALERIKMTFKQQMMAINHDLRLPI